jgi:hypothetical protein
MFVITLGKDTETCSTCKETKNLADFVKSTRKRSGLGVECLACSTLKHAEWIKKKNAAWIKKKRRLRPFWAMYKSAKTRAKDKELEFDLTENYLEQIYRPVCPVLGIPLIMSEGRHNHNSPSIDRIDPTKGYVQGNVCIISWRANKLKNDASLDELKALVRYLDSFNNA